MGTRSAAWTDYYSRSMPVSNDIRSIEINYNRTTVEIRITGQWRSACVGFPDVCIQLSWDDAMNPELLSQHLDLETVRVFRSVVEDLGRFYQEIKERK